MRIYFMIENKLKIFSYNILASIYFGNLSEKPQLVFIQDGLIKAMPTVVNLLAETYFAANKFLCANIINRV